MTHRRYENVASLTKKTLNILHAGSPGGSGGINQPLWLRKFISSTSDRLYCARSFGVKRGGPWHCYVRFTDERPLMTAVATGAVLWGVGDLAAQRIESSSSSSPAHSGAPAPGHSDAGSTAGLNPRRLVATSIFGSVVAGGLGLYWYRFLEALMSSRFRHGSFGFVAGKLGFEFLLWHPFTLVTFWGLIGAMEGHSSAQISASLRKEFLPTIGSEYVLWTPIDILNFWLVPVSLQVLVVNVGSLAEAVLLSYIHANGFPLLH